MSSRAKLSAVSEIPGTTVTYGLYPPGSSRGPSSAVLSPFPLISMNVTVTPEAQPAVTSGVGAFTVPHSATSEQDAPHDLPLGGVLRRQRHYTVPRGLQGHGPVDEAVRG